MRLRELRIALGLNEYHQLTERLQAEAALLDQLKASVAEQAAQAESSETDAHRLEDALAALEESAHEQESLLASTRQQIAAEESTVTHEWSLTSDLETELARTRLGMAELHARVATLAAAATLAAGDLQSVETQCQAQRQQVEEIDKDLAAAVARLDELHNQVQADKTEHLERMRQTARLQNDVVSFKAQVDNLRRERERLRFKTAQAAETLASLDGELQELLAAEQTLQTRLAEARQHQAERRQERERMRQLHDDANQLVAELRAQRSGLASRIEVLARLEQSHEGLDAGVREVFALLEQPDPAAWGTVVGMIADFLTVGHEYAPLIDLALGERARHFLVRDVAVLAEALHDRSQPFTSRVSFLPLKTAAPANTSVRPNRLIEVSHLGQVRMPVSAEGTPAHPGVIALAEQLVTCDLPELADLPAQLLGRTLIVRDLAAARAIAAHTSGYRFVTLQGELLEPDGTVTVGNHHAGTGILSRKSELRELRTQAASLDNRIAETEDDLADLRERIAVVDRQVEQAQEGIDVLAEQAADLRLRVGQQRQRREGLHQEVIVARTEISGIDQDIQGLEQSWQQAQEQAAAAEQQVQELQTRLQEAEQEIRQREQQRQQRQAESTTAKVTLAQIEERL